MSTVTQCFVGILILAVINQFIESAAVSWAIFCVQLALLGVQIRLVITDARDS